MTLLAPFGLLAGLLAIPIVMMHILRPHRDLQPVSSTYLWRALREPVAASQPWQRLRPSVPLLLQLLLVALLALALAQPARVSASPLSEHTVFIVDVSGSMLASDESPDRLDAAKERVAALRGQLPDGGSASLIVAGAAPEVLLVDSSDRALFDRELDRIRPTAGPADFDVAFTLAEATVSATRSTGWVLVSDGGLTLDQQRLAPAGTRYESVGNVGVNRAITALSVGVDDNELIANVTLANTGGPGSSQVLRIDVDNVTVSKQTVDLPAGAIVELGIPIPLGSRVEAFLDGDDQLLNNNSRAALAPIATDLGVRIVTSKPNGAFFVTEVLEAIGARVVIDPAASVDLTIYDGVAVPAAPAGPYISIASPTPPPGITIVGSIDRPIPTFLADDPILGDVDITTTAIAISQDVTVSDGEVLIGAAEGQPLLIEGRTGDIDWYHLTFDLEQSNLPVAVAYPVLFARMVGALTISDDVPARATIGQRLDSLSVDATVTSPRGVATAVPSGGLMPRFDRAGFWTVEDGLGGFRPVAVVFPSTESSLAVPDTLEGISVAADTTDDVRGLATTSTSLLPFVIALILAVLLLELLVAVRRIGVPRTQWLAGLVVRAVIVLCLIGALIDVQVHRSNGDVRAVLVVDVSDSLGAEGAAEVKAFVDAVLEGSGASNVAVVEVGRTVRVVQPFETAVRDGFPAPAGDGTDLVRGVRLASSLLDGSTRERIVVISDGRTTQGDLRAEIERLGELDVRLDAHTVATQSGSDIAIESVTAPTRVGDGEAYDVVANVVSEAASTAVVELVRNDRAEASQTVELAPGDNEVRFAVTSSARGLDRFTVRVQDASDAIPQNDQAYAAVSIEGPPRTLVIDGADNNGSSIEDALNARAVDVERRSVNAFPSLDELQEFSTVVLVDVHASALGAAQMDVLDAFVRDQGNGLVVVGGRQSFAVGGYAESRLEDLLPVESRAEDPTRKATVAEVLLIDASESMGACHCAPIEGSGDPFGGQPVEGGVNKTDISKTAAERAIGALSANDEVGVLAFNGSQNWILPLQSLPSNDVVRESLGQLRPSGETRIGPALKEAAEGLRESNKELKHIILFSDGFTPELFSEGEFGFDEFGGGSGFDDLSAQAKALADEGMTISVVATGEGAAPLLESIAEAGNGRFYPGRDLDEIPEIFVEEARIASRSFINEGEFVPAVTSTAAPVRNLVEAPPVLGYLASTPKGTTDVMLQVGEFADPLLSTWRVGLGKVTAWTSDGGEAWAAGWASWDGWADFWSNIVRDTFRLEGASGLLLRSEVRGSSLFLELESDGALPAGATPTAQVSTPTGETMSVELRRTTDTTFTAAVPALDIGSYAVGVSTGDGPSATLLASSVASRSYSLEYRPKTGPADDLAELSSQTGGRGEITAQEVFDAAGLETGASAWQLRWMLMLIAALLWPLDVALRWIRLSTLRADVKSSRQARRSASSAIPTTSRS